MEFKVAHAKIPPEGAEIFNWRHASAQITESNNLCDLWASVSRLPLSVVVVYFSSKIELFFRFALFRLIQMPPAAFG